MADVRGGSSAISFIELQFDFVCQRGVLLKAQYDHGAVTILGEVNGISLMDKVFDFREAVA